MLICSYATNPFKNLSIQRIILQFCPPSILSFFILAFRFHYEQCLQENNACLSTHFKKFGLFYYKPTVLLGWPYYVKIIKFKKILKAKIIMSMKHYFLLKIFFEWISRPLWMGYDSFITKTEGTVAVSFLKYRRLQSAMNEVDV